MILRRLFRVAVGALLSRAWIRRSNKWLSLAGVVVLFRLIDRTAARVGRRVTERKSA